MTQSGFDQCDCNEHDSGNCFTDSGTSSIELPLPENQCDYWLSAPLATLKKLGSLLLDIEGVNGTNITLSLPLIWLAEQTEKKNVVCTGTTGNFVLGFPIFQYYYVAYVMADNTIAFVDLPLSDETKEFINGPEYGGVFPPSSGYHHHVPTASNLMMAVGILLFAFQSTF